MSAGSPAVRHPRRWLVAAGTVAAGIAIGAVAGSVVPAGDGSPGYRLTPAGFAQFVDDYRARFGDGIADEVSASAEHVYVVRQDGPGTASAYLYDGRFREFGGSSSRSSSAVAFDMSAIDLPRLAGLVAGAPATTRSADGTVELIRVDGDDHAVTIHVENSRGQSGHLELAFDGTVLAVFPYRP